MRQRLRLSFSLAALGLTTLCSVAAPAQDKSPGGKLTGAVSQVDKAEIARGSVIYQQRCELCHFSTSEAKKIGPGLKGIYTRGKFADGRKIDDTSMGRLILDGGKDMPPFKAVLNPSQLRDLLAYLKTF
jgi:cytochrome c2